MVPSAYRPLLILQRELPQFTQIEQLGPTDCWASLRKKLRRLSMKSFSLLKLPVMLVLGGGAMLVLAPSSRAQAEIAPDHYDAVEALSAPAKPKAHVKQASANLTQEQRKRELVLIPASAADPNSHRRELLPAQDKPKPRT